MKLLVVPFVVALAAGPALPQAGDLDTAFQNLQQAETQKDAALVKKLAAETCALARKEAATPAPEAEDEKAAWTKHVAYARDIELRTEYALYATAVQSKPAETVDLIAALETQNPKSKYLDEAYGSYFVALTRTGAAAKIPALAEKALANFPRNEDLLLVLTDQAFNRQQYDRARTYGERLVAAMLSHPKPEGLAAGEWERKRTAALGRGYWVCGLAHFSRQQYLQADEDLRAALPLVKGSDVMTGAALFHLGVANYQLGKTMLNKKRVLEAVKFSEQAAAIQGPYAQQAYTNAHVMRTEAEKMR